MKKIAFIFIILAIFVFVSLILYNHWEKISTPYEYPAYYNSDEWYRLRDKNQDVFKLTEIPDNVLNSITTIALIKTVIHDPILEDKLDHGRRSGNMFVDREAIFSNIFKIRKGFKELIKRENTGIELLNFYKSIDEEDYKNRRKWVKEFIRKQEEYRNKVKSKEIPHGNYEDLIREELNKTHPEWRSLEYLDDIELILLNDSIFFKLKYNERLELVDKINKINELDKKYSNYPREYSLKLLVRVMLLENFSPIKNLLEEYKKTRPKEGLEIIHGYLYEKHILLHHEDQINKYAKEFLYDERNKK